MADQIEPIDDKPIESKETGKHTGRQIFDRRKWGLLGGIVATISLVLIFLALSDYGGTVIELDVLTSGVSLDIHTDALFPSAGIGLKYLSLHNLEKLTLPSPNGKETILLEPDRLKRSIRFLVEDESDSPFFLNGYKVKSGNHLRLEHDQRSSGFLFEYSHLDSLPPLLELSLGKSIRIQEGDKEPRVRHLGPEVLGPAKAWPNSYRFSYRFVRRDTNPEVIATGLEVSKLNISNFQETTGVRSDSLGGGGERFARPTIISGTLYLDYPVERKYDIRGGQILRLDRLKEFIVTKITLEDRGIRINAVGRAGAIHRGNTIFQRKITPSLLHYVMNKDWMVVVIPILVGFFVILAEASLNKWLKSGGSDA